MTTRTEKTEIGNLGVGPSIRYAQDQEAFDRGLISESRGISDQTKISVTEATYTSEFDTLFGLGAVGRPWPSFAPPSRYRVSRRRLFAEQVVPALGSREMQEMQIQRLKSFPTETLEGGEEKEKLLSLLGEMQTLDGVLIDINSRRSQYQKG